MEKKIFKDLHIKVSCVFVSCGFLRLYVFSDYTFSEWSIFNALSSYSWVLFLSWTLFYGWAFYFIFNVCVSLKEQFLGPCASPTKHLFQLSVSKAERFFGCVFFYMWIFTAGLFFSDIFLLLTVFIAVCSFWSVILRLCVSQLSIFMAMRFPAEHFYGYAFSRWAFLRLCVFQLSVSSLVNFQNYIGHQKKIFRVFLKSTTKLFNPNQL